MRKHVLALVACGLGLLTACGGGGSSSSSCTAPGSLGALAIQGQTAPDTGGGTYGSFTASTPIAAGDGGWAAYAATVLGGSTTAVAYVAPPGTDPIRVFAVGDAAPDATSGTISGFEGLWVSSSGWLLALVDVSGGGPTEGLVSARIDSGAVAEIHGIVYDDEALDGTGLAGTLISFRLGSIHLASDGTVFFGGSTAAGDGFWRSAPDATDLRLLVGTGSPLGGARSVGSLYATAVDYTATRYVFVADDQSAVPIRGVYGGVDGRIGLATYFETGDFLDAADSVGAIRSDQSLIAYGAENTTTGDQYVGGYFEIADNHGQTWLFGASDVPGDLPTLIARAGTSPPSAPATVTYATLGFLPSGPSTQVPTFWASLAGQPADKNFFFYGVLPGTTQPTIALYEGQAAPPSGSGNVTDTLLGLTSDTRTDVATNGDFAVVDVTSTSKVDVIWLIPLCGQFGVIVSGDATPGGGDTFVTDTAWRVTTANDVLVVRATLQTAGSGIFRRA